MLILNVFKDYYRSENMKTIKMHIVGDTITSNDSEAFSLHKKSNFGEPINEKIKYSLSEAMFLFEKEKSEIYFRNKKISKKEIINKFLRIDKRFNMKYPVFKNLREKGYVVKTALKFGADFRIYEKTTKNKHKHAKWIVFCESETGRLNWHEFSAKNRVAHSTKKKLLIAIVDEESDVTYYEADWIKL